MKIVQLWGTSIKDYDEEMALVLEDPLPRDIFGSGLRAKPLLFAQKQLNLLLSFTSFSILLFNLHYLFLIFQVDQYLTLSPCILYSLCNLSTIHPMKHLGWVFRSSLCLLVNKSETFKFRLWPKSTFFKSSFFSLSYTAFYHTTSSC